MMVLDTGLDKIFHAFGVFNKCSVAVFEDQVVRFRAEMVGFLLFVCTVDCGSQK